MGKFDRRNSMKMRRLKAQKKLKIRLAKKRTAGGTKKPAAKKTAKKTATKA
jgi:hypothetical protein